MSNNPNLEKECLEWYAQNKELYTACASCVHRLLTTLLEQTNTPFHSIQYRIKDQKSFLEKCMNPRYKSPLDEITDVCGLRIITYTNRDVDQICKIIEKHFSIDPENSVNKADLLHANEVGYLSVHYIATLNQLRIELDEYKPYRNIRFEIQVRTLLQHAWAEIEHDRSYKFSGALPKELKRRFYLVAGALELMDREFDCLSVEIDAYAQDVKAKAQQGNLDVEVDSTSLIEYLNLRLKDVPVKQRDFLGDDKEIIEEVTLFGIRTLAQLDSLITDTLISKLNWDDSISNYIGALRAIMMAHDPDKYFSTAWRNHWTAMDKKSYAIFEKINPAIGNHKNSLHII